MYCKKCGKLIADDSVYCNYCGAKQTPNNAIKMPTLSEDGVRKGILFFVNIIKRIIAFIWKYFLKLFLVFFVIWGITWLTIYYIFDAGVGTAIYAGFILIFGLFFILIKDAYCFYKWLYKK